MAARKVGTEAWAEYLDIYRAVGEKLATRPWFGSEWEARYDYLNLANPGGVWLQLVKKHWFDGNIHLETWVNNPCLERMSFPVVLHVETSKAKHGVSRNDFSKLFLERCGERILSRPGYSIKQNYAMEPLRTDLQFTTETLGALLEAELDWLQSFGADIDRTISDVRK